MNTESAEFTSCQKAQLVKRIIGNSNFLVQELNRRMKQELSLTLAKYEVLMAIKLSGNSEITMSDLSRELSVSNANMTGMTTRLYKEGLIDKKTQSSDRRIHSVALTDEGREKLVQANEKHNLWSKELMATINTEEIDYVNGIFDKIAV